MAKKQSNQPTGSIQKNDISPSYVMNRNVKFNGTIYHKDELVSADQECAEIFLRMGYMQ